MKKYDRLIFVSNSDTCRGPMAEAILKSKFLLSELEVESRGLVVLFPEPVNQKAEAILASHGLTMKDHTAKMLEQEDFDERTLILVMEDALKQRIFQEHEEQKALEKAKQILAKITTSKMSKSQKLYAAFQYMTSRANFSYRTWRGFSVYDGWEYDYALEMYEKRAGNCYNFACGFAMLAKAIGYQPQVIAGRVPGGVDGAPDGFTRHSLVKINGLYYDPEAQFDGWARGVYGLGYYPMYLQILSIRTI